MCAAAYLLHSELNISLSAELLLSYIPRNLCAFLVNLMSRDSLYVHLSSGFPCRDAYNLFYFIINLKVLLQLTDKMQLHE